ncbi:hypothetical protein OTT_0150 [Orientia tsutsugamushi str. Ikeda]|nr:hypothetical protein OTT_0150 [Orientia tsutsugamushi str. Ikeda]
MNYLNQFRKRSNKIIGEDLIIKRAYEALDQFNWSEDELITYEQELKRIWDNKAVEDYKLKRAKVKVKVKLK